jgi:hypothetical protein
MQRVLSFILFHFLLLSIVSAQGLFAYELRSEIRMFRNAGNLPLMNPAGKGHPGAGDTEYTFIPALADRSLYIQLHYDTKTDLRLSLSSGDLHLTLPSSADQAVIQVVFPNDVTLSSVSFTENTDFYTGLRDRSPYDLTLYTENPDSLEVKIPVSQNREQDILIYISNAGPVVLSSLDSLDGSEANDENEKYEITASQRERFFQFPFPSPSNDIWQFSPVVNIDSLAFELQSPPDFPSPLSREIDQILSIPVSSWRNETFEIYSWSSFPNILVWDCLDYDVQNRFFTRLSYFVEKKGYKGTLMTNEQLRGKHGWNAHDYRPSDLALFFNSARESSFELNPEEILMRTILIEQGILKEQDDETLVPGAGAIISIARESSSMLRQRFLTHEASHGIYFTSAEYRTFVKELWESLEEDERVMWRFFLGWYGYDPENEDLMINEFQAYLLQQSAYNASDYFGVRMRNLLATYPDQRRYLERGIGPNSQSFQVWAEQIENWIQEKWSLEAGNFSSLRKEGP